MEFRYHRKHERRKVQVAHPDRVRMGSGLKDDLLVLCERLIDIHRKPIEVAEGWHRAQLAVRKQACDLIFGCELHLVGAKTVLRRWRSTFQFAGSTVITNRSFTFTITTLAISFSGVWSIWAMQGAKRFRMWQHVIVNPFMIEIRVE